MGVGSDDFPCKSIFSGAMLVPVRVYKVIFLPCLCGIHRGKLFETVSNRLFGTFVNLADDYSMWGCYTTTCSLNGLVLLVKITSGSLCVCCFLDHRQRHMI